MSVSAGPPVEPSRSRATWVVWPILTALLQPAGWNDCPYGIVNDPFPGNCAAYVDTDHNGYCDHGELPPERRGGATPADATSSSGGGPTPDASVGQHAGDALQDAGRRPDRAGRGGDSSSGDAPARPGDDAAPEAAPEPEEARGPGEADVGSEEAGVYAEAPAAETCRPAATVADAGAGGAASAASVASSTADGGVPASQQASSVRPPTARRSGGTRQYYFARIALGTIAIYSVSRLLVARGRLRPSTHRRLWNVVVLFGFLGVGTTGLLLVLRVSYGLALPSPLEFLFWHVEAGIVFAIVGAIHLWWHWKYYWRIVRPASRGGAGADASRGGKTEDR